MLGCGHCYRNRMEKEIEQTLQEMRRQSEIKRLQMVQEQVQLN